MQGSHRLDTDLATVCRMNLKVVWGEVEPRAFPHRLNKNMAPDGSCDLSFWSLFGGPRTITHPFFASGCSPSGRDDTSLVTIATRKVLIVTRSSRSEDIVVFLRRHGGSAWQGGKRSEGVSTSIFSIFLRHGSGFKKTHASCSTSSFFYTWIWILEHKFNDKACVAVYPV